MLLKNVHQYGGVGIGWPTMCRRWPPWSPRAKSCCCCGPPGSRISFLRPEDPWMVLDSLLTRFFLKKGGKWPPKWYDQTPLPPPGFLVSGVGWSAPSPCAHCLNPTDPIDSQIDTQTPPPFPNPPRCHCDHLMNKSWMSFGRTPKNAASLAQMGHFWPGRSEAKNQLVTPGEWGRAHLLHWYV